MTGKCWNDNELQKFGSVSSIFKLEMSNTLLHCVLHKTAVYSPQSEEPFLIRLDALLVESQSLSRMTLINSVGCGAVVLGGIKP